MSASIAPPALLPLLAPDRVDVLGCAIDRLDMEQTLERIRGLILAGGFAQHVAINAAKLIAARGDEELSDIIARCEIVSADGQAVVWASRLLGDPLPARVAGVDLMQELLGLAEREGFGVYILGARDEVLLKAADRIRERHPDLLLAGMRNGYFADEEAGEVAEEIRAARPQILFVAISSPRKEQWLARYGRYVDVPFVMGVGGSVDVLAGVTRRAPRLVQRVGLEWAYRLVQEPRRLWRRYLVTNVKFLCLLAGAMARRRSHRPPLVPQPVGETRA